MNGLELDVFTDIVILVDLSVSLYKGFQLNCSSLLQINTFNGIIWTEISAANKNDIVFVYFFLISSWIMHRDLIIYTQFLKSIETLKVGISY